MNKEVFVRLYRILKSIRGAISALDYPFIVLPALLLRWAEVKNSEEGLEVYKEIYAPGRLFATYGMADDSEAVIDYLLQLEESQKSIVYGGYLSEALAVVRRVPVQAFCEIIRVVSEVEFDSTKEIYRFAEAFLADYSVSSSKMSDVNLSTKGVRQIEKIAMGALEDNDTVFDGFAGSGISAINVISEKNALVLQESNVRTACLAEMLCIISGSRAKIDVRDSLLSDGGETYSKVIMEPPFSLDRSELQVRELPFYSPDPDLMCVKYALSKMQENGKGIVLSPAGVLFRGGKAGLDREALICNRSIDTVIQLPQRSVHGVGVAPVVLVLRKNKNDDNILFVDASTLFTVVAQFKSDFVISKDYEELIRNIIENRLEVEAISSVASIEEIRNHEYSLVVNQYIRRSINYMPDKVDLKPLMERNTELLNKLHSVDEELGAVRGRK